MSKKMRVAACTQYGSPEVVRIEERPIPIPKSDEVLVKVVATTVNSADSRIRGFHVPKGFGVIMKLAIGFNKPRQVILGAELSGVVEAVGKDVKNFAVGDKIFADCGMKMGAHAQYRLFKHTDAICHIPDNLAIEDASAIIFGGATAYGFLYQKAKLQAGETVLINGASGAVGVAAIQLAKHRGATVTAVCRANNHALVTALGADAVIDYTTQKVIDQITYDVIMDNVGHLTWQHCKPALNDTGRFLKLVATLSENVSAVFCGLGTDKKMIVGGDLANNKATLETLKKLVEAGAYKPVVSKTYRLENIQEAYRHVDSQRKVGSVVVDTTA